MKIERTRATSLGRMEPIMQLRTDDTRAGFDGEGDWIVQQMFSEGDLAMSPEEYAARQCHNWGCFSFHRYRYRDPVLGAWIRRLGEIFYDEGELERCRQRFLTADEFAEVKRRERDEF